MTSNVLCFCLQAFIIQSLSSVVMDVSCVGLAAYAATPWAIATSHTVAPYTAPLNPMATPVATAYAAVPYTAPTAAPLAMPYTAAPIPSFPTRTCATPALAAANGGGLTITSLSPVPPNGVSLLSENSITGRLAVAGEVPFLSAVTLEGALPTVGSGVVTYKCGNGDVGMVAEDYNCGCNRCGFGGLGYDGYAPMGYSYDLYAPGYATGYNTYTGYRMY